MKPSNFILITVLIFAPPSKAAELKKWKDENGKTHYGSQPPASAKTTNLENQVSVIRPAIQKTRVILYSTSWCGYCKRARSFMRQKNISFDEYDIEKSAVAKRAYEQAGGKGVPLLVHGEKSLQGFSKENYQRFFKL